MDRGRDQASRLAKGHTRVAFLGLKVIHDDLLVGTERLSSTQIPLYFIVISLL